MTGGTKIESSVAPMMRKLSPIGAAVAVAFYCLALTPSLLPRPWYLQGLISGILAATGYLVGVFGSPRQASAETSGP